MVKCNQQENVISQPKTCYRSPEQCCVYIVQISYTKDFYIQSLKQMKNDVYRKKRDACKGPADERQMKFDVLCENWPTSLSPHLEWRNRRAEMECIKQTIETTGSCARVLSEAVPASVMLIRKMVQRQSVGRFEEEEMAMRRARTQIHTGWHDHWQDLNRIKLKFHWIRVSFNLPPFSPQPFNCLPF